MAANCTVASSVGSDEVLVSLMEKDSVIFHTGVVTNQQEDIKWYFNTTRIAQINGQLTFICTDVQCNEGTERFRDRLKLDNQTGSLTIMNITTMDSGVYELKIISSSSGEKIFNVNVNGVSAAEQKEVKRNKRESFTLDSSEIRKPNYVMTWYFNDTLIAQIASDSNKTCTDVQCKNTDERFRNRLEVNRTGSLIIKDTRITDSGLYKLQINISDSSFSITRVKRFSVTVTDSGLSSAAVAGIVIAVFVLLVVAALIAGVFCCRLKRYKPAAQNDNDVKNSSPNPKDIALGTRDILKSDSEQA
ncbi:Carcinoembryonic antigen-related cell adhesion molecule 6 [Labeo rohita]|uniref:Carcinoembryonic antigen-related cell adhesion molecule 6 n=1 Tax=Labeo rohita TaxID=84645 RepID=A0ABQ8MSX3_LABRO|nr:Carcinoembryonic antigen-related cell adhesion molecule 6 [Labeo rohita]